MKKKRKEELFDHIPAAQEKGRSAGRDFSIISPPLRKEGAARGHGTGFDRRLPPDVFLAKGISKSMAESAYSQ
jgi:hypothetical protein